jgi:CCR4-NOT transcription complex subunit 6
LTWKYRKEKLFSEFMCYNADILCIQEMDKYTEHWKGLFSKVGYDSVYKQRTRKKSDGCSIFWKSSQFELVDVRYLQFNKLAILSSINRYDEQRMTDNVAVMIALRYRVSGKIFIIANLHLFWDPTYSEIKIEQCFYALQCLHEFQHAIYHKYINDNSISFEDIPFILCGDFNSMPDSSVYQLLSTGSSLITRVVPSMKSSLQDMSQYIILMADDEDTSINEPYKQGEKYQCPFEISTKEIGQCKEQVHFKHNIKMKSTYASLNGKEPVFTNYTENFQGCLDYIWVSSNMHIVSVLKIIDENEASKNKALPSMQYPSDHISLLANVVIM